MSQVVTGDKYILKKPVKSWKRRFHIHSFIRVHATRRRSIIHKRKENNILIGTFSLKLNMSDIQRRFAWFCDRRAKLPLANAFSPIAEN